MVTGKQVAAYNGYATYLSCRSRRKIWPVQNETNTAAMDAKSDVKPSKSFRGKLMEKSRASYRDVIMVRKKTRAVTDKQRASSDEMVKALNAGLSLKTGEPVLSSSPPGTDADVAKATVAMSAATTEHDSEVLTSQLLPSFRRSLCEVVKISCGI